MDDYQVKLNDISRKVGILIARYNEAKEEYQILEQKNKSLADENKRLKEQLEAEKAKYESLADELNLTKLQKAIVPQTDEERTELKRKINEFIKEIDRRVALLND
ncbi:MAG TPA: hypothetical protein VNJ07_05775 [Chitinophagales bacterium]|nr:hypothetical protein [Chitinophagales bacterium]